VLYTVKLMSTQFRIFSALLLILFLTLTGSAQDRLKTMPGYDQYSRLSEEIPGSVKLGTLNVTWKDSTTFEYTKDGKQYRFDVKSLKTNEIGAAPSRQRGPRGQGPERGRQFDSSASPDGKLTAFYRDRNLWLSRADGSNENAITTDGSEKTRVKNGTAS